MDLSLQQYYEERFSMMSTQGWKDFIEDTQSLFDTYNQISTVETFEEFHKRKGQIDILLWILSLKDVSEQSYKELQNEEAV
jgi:hypothetical protein